MRYEFYESSEYVNNLCNFMENKKKSFYLKVFI